MFTKDDLISDIIAFYDQYIYAKSIIMIFHDAEAAEKNYNKSKMFFRLVASSCIDSYCMTLARLYEEDGKSKTIRGFVNTCKKNKHLFNNPDLVMEKLTTFSRKLKQDDDLKNVVKVILYRRNKYFAHNDKNIFVNDKDNTSLGYMPMHQIWMLLRETGKLLRDLSCELNYDVDKNIDCYIYNKDLDEMIDSNLLHRLSDSIM